MLENNLTPEFFKKKKKKKRPRTVGDSVDAWEKLGSRGVMGISAVVGGGISSSPIAGVSSKGLPRTARRLLASGRKARARLAKPKYDGDGDNKITNPLTGEDDLPFTPLPNIKKAKIDILGFAKDNLTIERRLEILEQLEPHVFRLVGGSIDSIEVDLADAKLASQLRGRVFYWNKSGTREINTSYRSGLFRAFAEKSDNIEQPTTGRNITITGSMNPELLGNSSPYIGDSKLIQHQKDQTVKFKIWAGNEEWENFHTSHYDWWTFPIDKGSASYGFMYDVSGLPIERLKTNDGYLQSLKDAAGYYLESVGWDMNTLSFIPNPQKSKGQSIDGNINGPRLFKISRSLQIHGLEREFDSVNEFAKILINRGDRIGREDYWNNPKSFVISSRYQNNNQQGLTGRMGPTPKVFKGQQAFDIKTDKEFTQLLLDRDTRNANKDKSSSDLIFDWKDEQSRRDYLKNLHAGNLPSGYSKFSGIIGRDGRWGKEAKKGLSELIRNNLDLLADVGLHWGQGNAYPAFYNPFGNVFSHSITGDRNAHSNQERDILGQLAPTVNPGMYWRNFEAWIRNPFSEMRTPDGKVVGVRLFFNNDRGALIREFDNRIEKIYATFAESYGGTLVSRPYKRIPEYSTQLYNEDSVQPFVRRKIKEIVANMSENNKHVRASINMFRKSVISSLQKSLGLENTNQISSFWFENYMKTNHSKLIGEILKENPSFLKPKLIDALEYDDFVDASELMKLIKFETQGVNFDIDKIKKDYYPESRFTREIVEELLTGITGKMSSSNSTDASRGKRERTLLVPGSARKRVSREEYKNILRDINNLWNDGFSSRDIGIKLNLSSRGAAALIRRLKKTGKLKKRPSERDRVLMYANAGYDASYIRTSLGSSSKLSTDDILKIVAESGSNSGFQRGQRGVNRLPEGAFELPDRTKKLKSKTTKLSGKMSGWSLDVFPEEPLEFGPGGGAIAPNGKENKFINDFLYKLFPSRSLVGQSDEKQEPPDLLDINWRHDELATEVIFILNNLTGFDFPTEQNIDAVRKYMINYFEDLSNRPSTPPGQKIIKTLSDEENLVNLFESLIRMNLSSATSETQKRTRARNIMLYMKKHRLRLQEYMPTLFGNDDIGQPDKKAFIESFFDKILGEKITYFTERVFDKMILEDVSPTSPFPMMWAYNHKIPMPVFVRAYNLYRDTGSIK